MVAWRKRAALVVLALAVATAVGLSEQYTHLLKGNVSDDAMTSMQYAKNLVHGNGLVFNVGERVDGYTNFLWVIAMAPLYAVSSALSLDFVALLIQVTIGLEALTLVLLVVVAERLWGLRLATFLALFLCVIDGSFTVWAGLGLEVHFLAMWFLLALVLWRSSWPQRELFTGLALAGAALTRPDAALFGACLLGSELVEAGVAWLRGDRRGARELLLSAVKIGAAWLAPCALHFAWHYAYYGEPFPNTYYTKLGGEIDAWSRGYEYLKTFLEVRWWVPAAGVLAVFGVGDKVVRAVFVYAALHTVYVVYVGGDFMSGHRFFLPQLPEYYLLVGAAVDLVWRAFGTRPLRRVFDALGVTPDFVAGIGLAASIGLLAFLAERGRRMGPFDDVKATWGEDHDRQRRLMAWLRTKKPPNASFATGLIGHTGFLGDLYVIDTMGIIDKATAHKQVRDFGKGTPGHEKQASVDAVFARKPTYVGIRVFGDDLWRRGYYLDIDLPPNTVDGLWVRDDLPERGHYLEQTRIGFDAESFPGWTATGTAFEHWPTKAHGPGQGAIVGAKGKFVNSYAATLGNRATGTLRSPPFALEGDLLVFRLAGGNDPDQVRASLFIDGKRVFSATGFQNDTMGRRSWNIAPYRGQSAELEIEDASTSGWGYIAVDEIVQWREGAKADPDRSVR